MLVLLTLIYLAVSHCCQWKLDWDFSNPLVTSFLKTNYWQIKSLLRLIREKAEMLISKAFGNKLVRLMLMHIYLYYLLVYSKQFDHSVAQQERLSEDPHSLYSHNTQASSSVEGHCQISLRCHLSEQPITTFLGRDLATLLFPFSTGWKIGRTNNFKREYYCSVTF